MDIRSDRGPWLGAALTAVALITGLRLVMLAFDHIDLFVDESQYWLWGQNLDFGYYSKPPLIGWLIRLVTDLAGSDAPFWVRMPGAVLHGATALILGALAARLSGPRAAVWVAVSYVTTPLVAVGGLLISTDTVMAPFYALALYAWFRLVETRAPLWALLAGVAAGLAFMAKYVGAYFLLGAGLSALLVPTMRIGWRNGAILLGAFAVVVAPNVVWNLTHGLATVYHTMDNIGISEEIGVVAEAPSEPGPSFANLFSFAAGQFAVFGPVLLAGLLAASLGAWRRAEPVGRSLVAFSLPVLLIVCLEAFLNRAYANWAVAAYFAGTLLAVTWLLGRSQWLLWLSLAANGAVAILLPVLTILAPWPEKGGRPLLHRYLGRAELSRQIIAAAGQQGVGTVVAADRDVLADLFHTGRESGLQFRAPAPVGRPHNYYEQTFPLPPGAGPVLYVLAGDPVCHGAPVAPVVRFDTSGGAHAKAHFAAYVLPEGCPDAAS